MAWETWQVWLVVTASAVLLITLVVVIGGLIWEHWGFQWPWQKDKTPPWLEDKEDEFGYSRQVWRTTGIRAVTEAEEVVPEQPVPYMYLAENQIESLYRQQADDPDSYEVQQQESAELTAMTRGSSALVRIEAGGKTASSVGSRATYGPLSPESKLRDVAESLVEASRVWAFDVSYDGSESAAASLDAIIRDASEESGLRVDKNMRDMLVRGATRTAARGAADELRSLADGYVVVEGSAKVSIDQQGEVTLKLVSAISKRLERIETVPAEGQVTRKRIRDSLTVTIPLMQDGLRPYAKTRFTDGAIVGVRAFGFVHGMHELSGPGFGTEYTLEVEALSVQGGVAAKVSHA